MTHIVLDPTRISGAIAFGLAALACARVAASTTHRSARLWGTVAAIEVLCVLEILFGFRYGWHSRFNEMLQARGLYDSRSQWQGSLLVAAVAIVAAVATAACRRHRADRAALTATLGATLGLAVIIAETISLHWVDAIMYAPAGPLVALAWMWIAAAALVIGAALVRLRSIRGNDARTRAARAG